MKKVPSISLVSCESSLSMKENLDRKKSKQNMFAAHIRTEDHIDDQKSHLEDSHYVFYVGMASVFHTVFLNRSISFCKTGLRI